MDNLEKLETLGTKDTGHIYIRSEHTVDFKTDFYVDGDN
jgi:hypothetical protein